MRNIIRDASVGADRHLGILEVWYPDESEWDTAAFDELKEQELEQIRKDGENYSRDEWFRNTPYFRYFRKFKKTYPVMMQVEYTERRTAILATSHAGMTDPSL